MSMEISNIYNNYTSSYTTNESKDANKVPAKNVPAEKEVSRKTASDELAYLSKKYDGYSFVAANFTPGMKYGSKDTINVAISPAFLKKMANDPELEKKYEKEIANMKKCDEEKVRNLEANGDRILDKGWAIDENGGISSWTVGIPGGNRIKVTSPNEYGAKIRQQKAEKKKAAEKVEKKRKEAAEKKIALEEKLKANKEEQTALKEKIEQNIARELILPEKRSALEQRGGRRLRLIFDSGASLAPVISDMVLDCQTPVNILFADTRELDGVVYGQMLIELPPEERDGEKILAWLKNSGIQWKEEE